MIYVLKKRSSNTLALVFKAKGQNCRPSHVITTNCSSVTESTEHVFQSCVLSPSGHCSTSCGFSYLVIWITRLLKGVLDLKLGLQLSLTAFEKHLEHTHS